MRELSEDEQTILRTLDTALPTSDLVTMAADLADVLRGRGLIIQARLVDVLAKRLTELERSADG